jgi:hypothetical protein
MIMVSRSLKLIAECLNAPEFPKQQLRPKYKAIMETNLQIMEDTHTRMDAHCHLFRKNLQHFHQIEHTELKI